MSGKKFELFVCEEHRRRYKEIVWHNDNIPEEHLENAGIINDYNRHRLQRIARRREQNGKSLLYDDYGVDFLSLDSSGKYHVGQAKFYNTRNVTYIGKMIGQICT
jgi:hypothetical protein